MKEPTRQTRRIYSPEPVTEGIMPEPQQRRCRAAFELLGLDRQAFSEEHDLSPHTLSKAINGKYYVSGKYIEPLNDLLDRANALISKGEAAERDQETPQHEAA